eukprot:TRINITY_DN11483_c0_g1_i1.p1 TRINITY_DN11483_c0_g1~~TRINITY_DN11483_c0_g1_i1.p1  ORF type:complete len:164 (+),score=52.44 TRINITY_DN11483_c0_g1_i1:49-492(+)
MAQQPIPITSLSVEQLGSLKENIEEELGFLQNSANTLRMAYSRYAESKNSLTSVNSNNQGRKLLVPLTGSLYVAGEVANTDTVMLDIGTGYYVSKSIPDAQNYFDRKMAMVKENIEKVQKQIATQRGNLEQLLYVMQQKMMQQQGGK